MPLHGGTKFRGGNALPSSFLGSLVGVEAGRGLAGPQLSPFLEVGERIALAAGCCKQQAGCSVQIRECEEQSTEIQLAPLAV
jgi:hypothetical protein